MASPRIAAADAVAAVRSLCCCTEGTAGTGLEWTNHSLKNRDCPCSTAVAVECFAGRHAAAAGIRTSDALRLRRTVDAAAAAAAAAAAVADGGGSPWAKRHRMLRRAGNLGCG